MSPQVLLRGGGRQCETVAGLDHKDTMEYVSGQQVIRVIIVSNILVNVMIIASVHIMMTRWCLTGSPTKV